MATPAEQQAEADNEQLRLIIDEVLAATQEHRPPSFVEASADMDSSQWRVAGAKLIAALKLGRATPAPPRDLSPAPFATTAQAILDAAPLLKERFRFSAQSFVLTERGLRDRKIMLDVVRGWGRLT